MKKEYPDKPIIIRVFEDDEDFGTADMVWCPFWGDPPPRDKVKDKATYYFLPIEES